ncbi:MAG: stage III sporulation protein AG [Clostridiales bacterium]|nr:stage III sporulation protein AG [Clostridiales bacterium]
MSFQNSGKGMTMKINVNKVVSNIKNLLKGEKKIKVIVAIGMIGIALIFLSTLFEKSDTKKEIVLTDVVSTDTSSYKKQLEKELTQILSKVSGVGEVKVMVTIEGTTEYVYAEELSTNKEENDSEISESYENEIVIIENDGRKEALVKKIVKPQVSGVVIVCQGGDNIVVEEKIYQAVSTALNISTNRICVAALTK